MSETSNESEPLGSQETIESTQETQKVNSSGQFQKGNLHPRYLGDNPPAPWPVGTMFGHLRLLSDKLFPRFRVNSKGKQVRYLLAECECTLCGKRTTPEFVNLKNGRSTRCTKCAHKAARENYVMRLWGRKPDDLDQSIRQKWFAIRGRCDDPTNRGYAIYGGRGIKLSEEFHNPITFINYMRSLEGAGIDKEIDRVDNDKGYERGNLRWATRSQNSNNRRNTRYVTYEGKRIPLADFARDYVHISYSAVKNRLDNGESPESLVKTGWKRGQYKKRV